MHDRGRGMLLDQRRTDDAVAAGAVRDCRSASPEATRFTKIDRPAPRQPVAAGAQDRPRRPARRLAMTPMMALGGSRSRLSRDAPNNRNAGRARRRTQLDPVASHSRTLGGRSTVTACSWPIYRMSTACVTMMSRTSHGARCRCLGRALPSRGRRLQAVKAGVGQPREPSVDVVALRSRPACRRREMPRRGGITAVRMASSRATRTACSGPAPP